MIYYTQLPYEYQKIIFLYNFLCVLYVISEINLFFYYHIARAFVVIVL